MVPHLAGTLSFADNNVLSSSCATGNDFPSMLMGRLRITDVNSRITRSAIYLHRSICKNIIVGIKRGIQISNALQEIRSLCCIIYVRGSLRGKSTCRNHGCLRIRTYFNFYIVSRHRLGCHIAVISEGREGHCSNQHDCYQQQAEQLFAKCLHFVFLLIDWNK